MFKNLSKKLKIQQQMLRNGLYVDIQSKKLKSDVDFVLYNLPKKMVKGIEILEKQHGYEKGPQQIIVKPSMNAMDIKRQIGLFVFREKRWEQQELITKKLLAQEKIDLKIFYEIYNTDDYMTVYEFINSDVFAVSFGNDSMDINEIAHAVNSLYIKKFTELKFNKQHEMDDLIEKLTGENPSV